MQLYPAAKQWTVMVDLRTAIIKSFEFAPCVVRSHPNNLFTVIPVQHGPRFPDAPPLDIVDTDMYVPLGPIYGQTIH